MRAEMSSRAFLVIGLGGTGGRVLSSLVVGDSSATSIPRNNAYSKYLYIDAYEDLRPVDGVDVLKLDVAHRNLAKLDAQWFPGEMIPDKTSGSRLWARMALASNAERLRDHLASFARLTQVQGSTSRVVIVGSLAGGVGGGIVAQVSSLCRDTFLSNTTIEGFFLLPHFFPIDGPLLQSRTYSALHDLEALTHKEEPPFDSIYLVSNEMVGDAPNPFDWLANYVQREVLNQGTYLYKAPDAVIPPIASDIVIVNDELLAYLKSHPTLLYELTPRKFEEVIAVVLKGLGYDVELTRQSRDGGKDLYAVHHSRLGDHLYLVECKRYAPDRPVGVDIVRSLYGVVQQERATMGVVVTTSYFTKAAREFRNAVSYSMTLKEYKDLEHWLRDYFTTQ
jgi:HJR/Mrr/RecB family endonuclease